MASGSKTSSSRLAHPPVLRPNGIPLLWVLPEAVSLSIGLVYGLISGYFGGVVDSIMMRVVDVLYGFPFLIFVIVQ